MKSQFQQLFTRLCQDEPSRDFAKNVMLRIENDRMRNAKINCILFSIMTFVTVIVSFPTLNYFFSQFSENKVMEYMTLLVSDGSYAFHNIHDMVFMIVSSWPIIPTIIIIAVIIAFLEAVSHAFKYSSPLLNRRNIVS